MKWGLSHQRQGKNLHMIFCPFGISHYFKTIICADDTQEHKPNAAPILKYVELSKTDHRKYFISEIANMTVNVRKMRELILL